jgi:hypothetical protein
MFVTLIINFFPGPYNFKLTKDNLRYLVANDIRITGKIKITKADGTDIGDSAASKVSVIDYFGQAWINKIAVHCNNNLIYDGSGSNYHLKVLANSLLNYDDTAVKTQLKSSGFYGDDGALPALAADSILQKEWEDPTKVANLNSHRQRFASSKWVEFSSLLECDLFRTQRLWPNGLDLEVVIHRQPAAYFIQSLDTDTEQYNYEIKDLQLIVKKVQPNETFLRRNNVEIAKKGAKMLWSNWSMNTAPILKDSESMSTARLFRSFIPSKTVYFFVETDALNGKYSKNPSYMKPWDIKEFTQKINGVVSPVAPLRYDWDGENVATSYHQVFDATTILGRNRGNLIKYDLFKKTRFMIVYDNTCEGSQAYYDSSRSKVAEGSVDIDVTFKKKLPCNIHLVAFGIDQETMLFDQDRTIWLNPPELR